MATDRSENPGKRWALDEIEQISTWTVEFDVTRRPRSCGNSTRCQQEILRYFT
ncbi:MAG: hypothetical protein U5J63_03965 [Fodinibius sp.]|nr:hypothetical protein [Fodinibius sp.]